MGKLASCLPPCTSSIIILLAINFAVYISKITDNWQKSPVNIELIQSLSMTKILAEKHLKHLKATINAFLWTRTIISNYFFYRLAVNN